MNKNIVWLAAIPLIAAGILNINPAFADTMYEPGECNIYYDSIEEVDLLTMPVGCRFGVKNGLTGISDYDANIISVGETDGIMFILAKKIGFTLFNLELADGEIADGGFIAMDVQSNVPSIINNPMKLYLAANYGKIDPENEDNPFPIICDMEEYSCYVYLRLNIEDVSEDNLSINEKAKINYLLGDDEVLAYGNVILEVRDANGDTLENIHSLNFVEQGLMGDYTTDIKWSGLDLGKPAAGYKRNFYVIRLYNDEAVKIPAEVDEEGNLVFPSGKFGSTCVYAVAYEDVKVEEEAEDKTRVPDTGANMKSSDSIILSFVGCMAAGVILSLVAMPRIRKYIKK